MGKTPSKAVQAYQWLWLTILNDQTPAQFWLPIRQLIRYQDNQKKRDEVERNCGHINDTLYLQYSYFVDTRRRFLVTIHVTQKDTKYIHQAVLPICGYQSTKKAISDWLKQIALVVQQQVDVL